MAGEYRWHLVPDVIERKRFALIRKMGGRCKSCGCRDDLEFHHPNGKKWRSNAVSRFERLRRYETDFRNGELILLCNDCHNDGTYHPDDCFCSTCRGEQW